MEWTLAVVLLFHTFTPLKGELNVSLERGNWLCGAVLVLGAHQSTTPHVGDLLTASESFWHGELIEMSAILLG